MKNLECKNYTFHNPENGIASVVNKTNPNKILYSIKSLIVECLKCPHYKECEQTEIQQNFMDAFQANRLRLLWLTPKKDE